MKTFLKLMMGLWLLGFSSVMAETNSNSTIIAKGSAANLSQDAFNAYMEALSFCLKELGQKSVYSAQEVQQIKQAFQTNFQYLPFDSQVGLANARTTWNQYRTSWNMLQIEQKKEFAYSVISLAYGEQMASNLLGMNNAGGSSNGYNASSGYNQSASDMNAQSHLNAGGTSAGDGTFEYYNASTGGYDYQ